MEKGERSPNQNLIQRLFDAACNEDWDLIDDDLIAELVGVTDGNRMAEELLVFVEDDNPNIRDVVATSLAVLGLTEEKVKDKVVSAMVKMATGDEEIFPSGRAAVFLLKNKKMEEWV